MSIHSENQPYSIEYDPQGSSIISSRWETDKNSPQNENAMKMVKVEMKKNGDIVVSTLGGELTDTGGSFWNKILCCFKPDLREKSITGIYVYLIRPYFSYDRITPLSVDIDIQNSQLRDDICAIFKNSPNVDAIKSKIEKCIIAVRKENRIKLQQIQQIALENINTISLPINNRIENAAAMLLPQLNNHMNDISDIKEESIDEPLEHRLTPKDRDLNLVLEPNSTETFTIADLKSILRDPALAACFSMEIIAELEQDLRDLQDEQKEAVSTDDIDEINYLLFLNTKKIYICIRDFYQIVEKVIHDNLIKNPKLSPLTKAGLRVFEQQLSDFRVVAENYNNLNPWSVSKPILLHMIELIKASKLIWHIE